MVYLAVFALLLGVELLYFLLARRLNIVDCPNSRSSHRGVVLRGGGVIFPISVVAYVAVYGVWWEYRYFLISLLMIACVSFVDDVRGGVSRRLRFGVHLLSLALLIYSLGWWSGGALYALLVGGIGLVVGVGIINAYNFMDGINGITALYSISILAPLALVNYQVGFIEPNFIYFVLLSLVVFCIFNLRGRALCFAGDVGSVSIAFILLYLLYVLIAKSGDVWYLAFMVVYGVDSSLTIIHRLILGENIFLPHRRHLYQILVNERGIPHVVVSAAYAVLQLVISLGFIYSGVPKPLYAIAVTIALSATYINTLRAMVK